MVDKPERACVARSWCGRKRDDHIHHVDLKNCICTGIHHSFEEYKVTETKDKYTSEYLKAERVRIMTSRDFCFWLQGFFEIAGNKGITEEQTDILKKHLNLVFKHEIDPSMGDKEHQDVLDKVHHHDGFLDPLIRC